MIKEYLERTGFKEFSPKAALFDMDGVLYDSMPYHGHAWHDSMAYYGINMSYEEAFAFEGMRGVETIKLITKRELGEAVSDEKAEEMYRKKSEFYSAFPTAEQIPDVHRLQELMVEKGLRIGIVTGSGQRTLIDRILNDFHGLVTPEAIVTANDVTRGKPAPDPYLAGMKKIGTEPWETIVIENAPLGVKAAVAAGCFTIAVNTGPLPDQELKNAGADMVLKNMKEAMEWLRLLEIRDLGLGIRD